MGPVFGFEVKTQLRGVTPEILWLEESRANAGEYHRAKALLAGQLRENFANYESGCLVAVRESGPKG